VSRVTEVKGYYVDNHSVLGSDRVRDHMDYGVYDDLRHNDVEL
jgi:hypothetical protein